MFFASLNGSHNLILLSSTEDVFSVKELNLIAADPLEGNQKICEGLCLKSDMSKWSNRNGDLLHKISAKRCI